MSEYDVLINKYNALNAGYDQLYPKPMKHANTHANGGADPITPSDIGAYSKNETDTLLANKAPAGYGLGAQRGKLLTSNDDLNNILENGWYYWDGSIPQNAPDAIHKSDGTVIPIPHAAMRVDSMGKTSLMQTVIPNDSNSVAEIKRTRAYGSIDYGFREWGFENPPMSIGEEYRTTERYLGKPVYVKVVNCGDMPASKSKNVAHGIKNISAIVSCTGYFTYRNSVISLPYARGTVAYVGSIWASETDIVVWADNSNYTNYNAYGIIKCTKTTD